MKNLSILFLFASIFSFAQNSNKALWDSVNVYSKNQNYEKQDEFLKKIQQLNFGVDDVEYLKSFTKRVYLKEKWQYDKLTTFINVEQFIVGELSKNDGVDLALLKIFYANFLLKNFRNYVTLNEQDSLSIDFREWPLEMKFNKISKLITESLSQKETLKQIKSESFKDLIYLVNNDGFVDFFQIEKAGFSLAPTLYDVMYYANISIYENMLSYNILEKEIPKVYQFKNIYYQDLVKRNCQECWSFF